MITTDVLADVAPAGVDTTSHGPQAIAIAVVVLIAAAILFTLFRNGFRPARLGAAVLTVLVAAFLVLVACLLLSPRERHHPYVPRPYTPAPSTATQTP